MDNNLAIDEVLAKDIENLKNMEPGSAEKAKEVQNIDTLYRLNLEQAKLEEAKSESYMKNHREAEAAKRQEKQDYIKAGVEVFKVAVPLAAYGFFYEKGLKFETTGVYTSSTVRGLLTKMKFPMK